MKLYSYLIRTKFISFNARIIRFSIEIRGKCFIDFGVFLTTRYGCRIEVLSDVKRKLIVFGHNIQINDFVNISIMKRMSIGNNVLMASDIYISDNSHGFYRGDSRTYLLMSFLFKDLIMFLSQQKKIMFGLVKEWSLCWSCNRKRERY